MAKAKANLSEDIGRILITGGTGLVGSRLSEVLTSKGYKVAHLSRNATNGTYPIFHWNIKKKEIDPKAFEGTDVIIHLAGAGVADKRWSSQRKKEILDSRVQSTRLLYDFLKEHGSPIKQFISASAIGYYGWDTGDQLVDESSGKGDGFLADVVADWEAEVERIKELKIKTAAIRTGIVLSEKGGAMVEIAKPIKMGAGAPLGSGKQWMSWIHIDDLCEMFIHVMEAGKEGIYNGVSPTPATNQELTRSLAKALRKPLFLPNVPTFALRLLVGEMAGMLVGGNKVSSKKIEEAGFNFEYPSLDSALKDLT